MGQDDRWGKMGDAELCAYLKEVEDEYGVRIRVSLNPLARASGKSSHAVVATAYYPTGKRIPELEGTQCLYPGGTSKTFAGAAFYITTQLVQEVDAWAARKKREEETWEPGVLTPLEEYIARSK